MRRWKRLLPMILLLAGSTGPVSASGVLHGPIRITSALLGYDLQYWIYLPEHGPDTDERPGLPELYVTDGRGYLSGGGMVEILDREISSGRIEPVAAIFIDSLDPDDPATDRRYGQFMCNADYARFFLEELMPEVSDRWTGADKTTRRGLMGVSFGAINAACFGLMAPGAFQVLILHSPANREHVDEMRRLYREKELNPAAYFISHGGRLDNGRAARRFAETLEDKGYTVRHVSNDGRHDWESWGPLLDDSLRAFVGLGEADRID